MKKFIFEIIILGIQLFMFYIFPLFAGPMGAIGMVLLLILATFFLSLILGSVSDKRIRFFYPLVTAVLFIPSVFIYYNESAMVHSVWYLVISFIGLGIGGIINAGSKKIWKK